MNESKLAVFAEASQTIIAAVQAMYLSNETGDGSSGVQFFNLDDPVLGKAEIQIKEGRLLFFHIITPECQRLRERRNEVLANWRDD